MQEAHVQSWQQYSFLRVIHLITISFKSLYYQWHLILIQQHSLFHYMLETYLLCSSPCSPEGTVKHSSMWPCNNLRTSPPIRYPWIKEKIKCICLNITTCKTIVQTVTNTISFVSLFSVGILCYFKKSQKKRKISCTLGSQLNIAKWENLQISK